MRWHSLFVLLSLAIAAGCAPPPVGDEVTSSHVTSRDGGSSHQGPSAASTDDDSGAANGTEPAANCGGTPRKVDSSGLDSFFEEKMAAARATAISVAVIGDRKLKWTKAYGLADTSQMKPATPDTLFMLASVSKTVTAVSLMQLMDDPKNGISLDDAVDAKLGFSLRNPAFPDVPITYRMLLTHTSSLIDSPTFWARSSPDKPVAGDSPTPLREFLLNATKADGAWSAKRPGTSFAYSNTGASMVGLLVEQITHEDLQAYANANIFAPLGMSETSYFLRDLDTSHIAMPYDGDPLQPMGYYGYPDYPDGQLRTSAPQLARFLLMLAGHGACGGQRVLEAATVADMERVQLPAVDDAQGLILFHGTWGGRAVVGHDGADRGVSTEMWLDPATGDGFVLLTNGSANLDDVAAETDAIDAMGDRLMELTRTL